MRERRARRRRRRRPRCRSRRASPTSRGPRAVLDGVRVQWRRRCAARCTRNRNGLGTPTSASPTSSTSSRRSAAPRFASARDASPSGRSASPLSSPSRPPSPAAAPPRQPPPPRAARRWCGLGSAAAASVTPILAELASLLQEAAADHATSLATLDAEKLRAAEAIERESYERRLALAHSELRQDCSGACRPPRSGARARRGGGGEARRPAQRAAGGGVRPPRRVGDGALPRVGASAPAARRDAPRVCRRGGRAHDDARRAAG